jgi:hypothetical protein
VGLLIARPLLAQTTANGSLRGTATDQQGAVLPGVSMSLTSANVPGIRTATTDRDGRYRFPDVPPGSYTIVAELDGFSRFVRTPITVSAGLNVTVDVSMSVGAISETIEVKQETPLLESQSALQAVNISGEMLRAMPLSERREWFGAVTLAPGVTTSESVNNEKLIYVHGADFSANIVQIDGADMTPTLGSTLRYTSLNTDAIDDMQIKTAGVDASAPLGLGGIINIATASGTNRVKGAATLSVQPRAWNGSNVPGGTSSTVDQKQVDLSLGAPLVKDRLWAFGAYRHIDTANGISRTSAQLDALRGLVPSFTPFDSTNVANFWFAKITTQFSSSHQLTGFVQHDVNPLSFADAVTANPRQEATGGSGASLRLSSVWSDHLTTRAAASYNDKRRDVLHALDPTEPLQRVYQGTIVSGGLLFGNGRLVDRGAPLTGGSTQPNSKITLSFDATMSTSGRWGSHDVQAGVYAQPRIQVALRDFNPNGGFVFEEAVLRQPGNFGAGVVPFHRVTFDGVTNLRLQRRGQDYAVYVQDAWHPVPRLTISPGLRIDRIVWTDQQFSVTTERSTAVGPRFGLNYALTADTRNVVRAHWVRVHDQAAQTGTSIGTSTLAQRDLFDLDLDGTFETVLLTPATLSITPGRSIDPEFHQPFAQEWGAGYDKQFGGQVTAGVDVLHRDFRDRSTLVETNGRYNGNVFLGYSDEAFNQVFQATNNRWNWPVYTSLELSLTKRTPNVQGIASYVRQWRHIGGTWQPNDPASFIQPDAFPNDRGIGSSTGSTSSSTDANSLSGTHMTQASTGSAQWQDHTVRMGVTYQAPWNLLLASTYTFQSGGWSGPIITRIAAADPSFGPATVTLSNGRRVANPLATTFRFLGPTRSDGQLTTPPLHVWNVRVGRRFALRRLTFDASLDVFNVTNNGADQGLQLGANQLFNPLFGATSFRQLPRSAQFVLRTTF